MSFIRWMLKRCFNINDSTWARSVHIFLTAEYLHIYTYMCIQDGHGYIKWPRFYKMAMVLQATEWLWGSWSANFAWPGREYNKTDDLHKPIHRIRCVSCLCPIVPVRRGALGAIGASMPGASWIFRHKFKNKNITFVIIIKILIVDEVSNRVFWSIDQYGMVSHFHRHWALLRLARRARHNRRLQRCRYARCQAKSIPSKSYRLWYHESIQNIIVLTTLLRCWNTWIDKHIRGTYCDIRTTRSCIGAGQQNWAA